MPKRGVVHFNVHPSAETYISDPMMTEPQYYFVLYLNGIPHKFYNNLDDFYQDLYIHLQKAFSDKQRINAHYQLMDNGQCIADLIF